MQINVTGSIQGLGDYPLIDYNTGSWNSFTLGTSTTANFYIVPGTLPSRTTGYLAVNPGNSNELDLNVIGLASITWTGTGGNNHWDTTTPNWVVQNSSIATTYIDPTDSVIFDDTAGLGNTSVSISGTGNVSPGSVTFNNNNLTYTVSGPYGIAGPTGMSLTGTGTVIVLNANPYSGPTTIGLGATLQLGNGLAGSDGNIANTQKIVDNGTLIYDLFSSQAYGGVISGSGALVLQGGYLTLTNPANSYASGTTISGGTLQLGTGQLGLDGSVAGTILNDSAMVFDYYASETFGGAIGGNGTVTTLAATC